jgi:hypothetical protein
MESVILKTEPVVSALVAHIREFSDVSANILGFS